MRWLSVVRRMRIVGLDAFNGSLTVLTRLNSLSEFIDPLLLFSTIPRPVSFVAARVTCDKLWLGRFCLLARAIPVRRAQDYRKPGSGLVYQPDSANPTLIRGTDTKFTSQLEVRGGIVLPDTSVLEVSKIVSDTECELKSAPSPTSAALLNPSKPTKYKYQPYENQETVYSTVHAVLQARGAIGIFAEGGSHDRSSLLPFKAGAAIMALGAMAANPGLSVKILPVGLNYFHPDKFRSTAAISYGEPIAIPQEMVEDYKAGGERKRKAVGLLLQQTTEAIKMQTVNAPDYNSLLAIQTVRRLVTPLNSTLSIHQKLDITRKITSYYLTHQEAPEMKNLVKKCLDYNDELLALNVRDHQVMKYPVGVLNTAGMLIKRVMQLVVGGVLAVPGLPLNLPIGLLAQVISAKKAVEAKNASTVKLEGKDVITSWKVLVILGVAPVWYGAWLGAIDWFLIVKRRWTVLKTLLANPAIYAALWGIGFSNVWFADNFVRTFKSLRCVWLAGLRCPFVSSFLSCF
jgi:glycerol-3-phosphate O-acyltransferase/dihydroxyacetone phosphate acyltransferase